MIDIPRGKVTPLKGLQVDGWLPDSKTLYGTTSEGEIATVGRDGTGLRQLTHTRIVKAWSGVEVRSTRDGRLLDRFTTPTPARSLALSASRVAVLADNTHKGSSIDLYTRHGKLLRSVKVGRSADNISISGHWIIFTSRGAIDVVDTDTGEIRSVSRVQHLVNATIDGHRVAWAEQHEDGTSLIRALELP